MSTNVFRCYGHFICQTVFIFKKCFKCYVLFKILKFRKESCSKRKIIMKSIFSLFQIITNGDAKVSDSIKLYCCSSFHFSVLTVFPGFQLDVSLLQVSLDGILISQSRSNSLYWTTDNCENRIRVATSWLKIPSDGGS